VNGATLFISDLHLDPEERPETVELFRRFLRGPARHAAALYLLGDLFEVWIGDDDDTPAHAAILDELLALAAHGVPTAFLAGNRDLLAGSGFAARSGCRVLRDPTTITLHGVPVLLTHGDLLCTDDLEHLAFRSHMARADVRAGILARPLAERRTQARQMRRQSEQNKQTKPPGIMDVNPGAVDAALADSGARLMIHGHTHRPALHGDPLERAVLGDWHASAVILACTTDGFLELQRLDADLGIEVLDSAPLPR
jgi:UDP-2,3-diacylglucosamine hydrolase